MSLLERMARAVQQLGVESAAVVVGEDRMDEVSLQGATHVLHVMPGKLTSMTWQPADFGLKRVDARELAVESPGESADRVRAVLEGVDGPAMDIVLANASAALWVAGAVGDLRDGVDRASEAITSGEARRLLDRWIAITNSSGQGERA
jgi:anthranilate phosphoribosyltransferase